VLITILVLAHELARPQDGSATLRQRHPGLLTFGFGLLHGLGFAGALREAGLPSGEVVGALLGFNAGIDAGQLAFVLGVAALRWAISAPLRPWRRRLGLAYVVGTVAACLAIERTVQILG
jgi:hypothetical protein